MHIRKLSILVLLAGLCAATSASAGVLVTSSRVNNPFSFVFFPGASSTSAVPFDDVGNTSKSFTLATAQTVVITVSAECYVTAGGTLAAVILVDGVNIATGDGGSPLHYTRWCIAKAAPELASRTVYRALAAGTHTVSMTALVEAPPFTGPYTAQLEKIVLAVTN